MRAFNKEEMKPWKVYFVTNSPHPKTCGILVKIYNFVFSRYLKVKHSTFAIKTDKGNLFSSIDGTDWQQCLDSDVFGFKK